MYCFKCHPVSSHLSVFSEQIHKTQEMLPISQRNLSPRLSQPSAALTAPGLDFTNCPLNAGFSITSGPKAGSASQQACELEG